MHQYFEAMPLALRTLKKWPFCLCGVFTQAWRNRLLQFFHKLQLTSVAISDRKESLDVEIHNIHPYNSQS